MKQQIKRFFAHLTPPRNERSVILVYHSVCGASRNSTDPVAFGEQLDCLKQTHHIVGLREFVAQVTTQAAPLAAVTFDDGFADNYEIAFGLLAARAIPFTVFVTTSMIESGTCNFGQLFLGRKAMSWGQLKEMAQSGVEVGSHMHTHTTWNSCSDEQVLFEVSTSMRCIEEKVNKPVAYFAYPHGLYDSRRNRILEACGIEAAFTGTHASISSIPDRFAIPRLSILAEDTLVDLAQSIRGQRDLMSRFGAAKRLSGSALSNCLLHLRSLG